MEEYPICRLYREVSGLTIGAGTSEILREIIRSLPTKKLFKLINLRPDRILNLDCQPGLSKLRSTCIISRTSRFISSYNYFFGSGMRSFF